ncbi:MAG: hypothetical protein PHE83_17980 [Opitutaceae bacterium]|nr:hypothetical protein [Opitutaceae bacterium]
MLDAWKLETTRTALAYRGRCRLYDNRLRLVRWFYTFKALVCVWLDREFTPTPDDYEYHYGFEDWHDIAALGGGEGWTEFGAGGWVELLRVPAGVLRRWQYIVVQESWP